MKTRITYTAVVIYLLVFSGAAFAQMPVSFGLKGGLSSSKLDTDSPLLGLEDSRTALAGGAFIVVDLPGFMAIQAEVLYVPKGGSEDVLTIDENAEILGTATMVFQANYIEIPILAKISLGPGPVHLLAGPAFAFRSSSKITSDELPGIDNYEFDWDGLTDSDIGFVIGADVAIGKFLLDARYTHGLTDVSNSSDDPDALLIEIKNRAFLVTAGFVF